MATASTSVGATFLLRKKKPHHTRAEGTTYNIVAGTSRSGQKQDAFVTMNDSLAAITDGGRAASQKDADMQCGTSRTNCGNATTSHFKHLHTRC